jgi:hypothetical protein
MPTTGPVVKAKFVFPLRLPSFARSLRRTRGAFGRPWLGRRPSRIARPIESGWKPVSAAAPQQVLRSGTRVEPAFGARPLVDLGAVMGSTARTSDCRTAPCRASRSPTTGCCADLRLSSSLGKGSPTYQRDQRTQATVCEWRSVGAPRVRIDQDGERDIEPVRPEQFQVGREVSPCDRADGDGPCGRKPDARAGRRPATGSVIRQQS